MSAVSKSRLLATSAIAGLAIMQMASPAQAQDYGRFIPEGQQATIDNPEGETIEGEKNGIRSSGTSLTLTNEGTIRGNGSYDGLDAPPEGGVLVDGGPATITNGGTISGGGHGISTAYFYNANTQLLEGRAIGVTVDNSGTISGEEHDGIRLIGGGAVTNSGTISGGFRPDGVPTSGDGVSMFAYDDQDLSAVTAIGTLTNEAGGTVAGTRFGAIISGGAVVENEGSISGLTGGLYIQTNTTEETGKTASVTNGGTISGGNGVTFGSNLESSELVNSGTITGTSGFAIANGSYGRATITNEADGVIEGATIGVYDDEGGIDLVNAGTIRGNGSYDGFDEPPHAGVTILGAPSTVENSGTISGAGAGITTAYYYNVATGQIEGRATDTEVSNSGAISGESNDGIRLIGGGSVTNSGAISGSGRGDADGISMYAYTDQAAEDYSALVTNQAGGTISGERFGIILSGGGDIDNAGAIEGIVGGVFVQGTALDSDDRSGVTASVVNSGTIRGTGDFGGSDGDGHGLVFGSDMASATLDNSGEITSDFGVGVLQGSLADVTVTNAADGTITGATSGVYANSEGTLALVNAGTIRGEGSYDGFDRTPDAGVTIGTASSSVTNSGTISGAGAGITTVYVFDEETGALVGLAKGTEIDNSGTIAGESNDGVRLIGGGSVTNSGTISGTGAVAADGISMYGFADQASDDYSASVTNAAGGSIEGERFGIILSGGGDVDNAGAITGTDGGVFIQGTALDSGDRSGLTASLANSGTITGTRADGLNGYGVGFGSDLATASLDNSGTILSEAGAAVFHGTLGDVTIANAADGVMEGATHGIYAGGDGTLTLDNAGTIRGNGAAEANDAPADAGVMIQSAGASVTNSGTISGAGYGIVTQYYFNEDTGQLEARATGTEIVNSGTIRGETNDGVRLFGGGSVANSGTIEGLSGELTDGVTIQAFAAQDTSGSAMLGSVVNEAGGTIAGVRYGVLAVSGASVTNAGTISGGLNGVVIGRQSSPGKAGELVNSGTIEGGVLIDVDTATADNSGTIVSDTGVAFSSLGQIAFVNSGTLTGGDGVAATLSAFDDSVTLQTGSAITGLVDAGEGIDSLTLDGDVLELTEAQQVGAVAGFETLEVANGYWTSAGYVGEFESVQIASGATLKVGEVATEFGPDSAILTTSVVTGGTLVLDFDSDEVLAEADDLVITGTGTVRLEGAATIVVDRADAAQHTGRTEVANGTLVLTGEGRLASTVATEGDGVFQLGDGGTTGIFEGDLVNDGRFVFNRSDDYDFIGAFSGTGTLDKMGAGTLSFTGDYDFDGITNILGGSVRIGGMIDPETDFNVGGGSLDLSGNDQTIGGLAGQQGASVNIGANQLTVDQEENSEFAGEITGTGGFAKTGSGTLNLTGTNSYTGPTTIGGGKLAVNGSISSPVFVNAGGALGGNGTVGSTNVGNGGTIAPGNSIGRLTVAGDLAFAAGAVYEVEVNAAGQADRIDATGTVTIDSDASVAVLAADGNYAGRTDYVILTGAEGVEGTFGSVTSDLAFLDPLLRYSADTVTLSLYRNDVDFADVAVGANQAAVAGAIQSRGIDDPLFEAVVNQNAAGARAAYADLSGEIIASTISGLNDDSRYLRGALLGMAAPEASGAFVWGSAFGGWGDFAPDAGRTGMDTDHKGLVAGFGYGGNGFAAALSAGIGSSDFDLAGKSDRAKADSKYLAVHAVYGTGEGPRAAFGLAYAWHDVDTNRSIGFAPLAQSLTSQRDADTLQLFTELGYDVATGDVAVTPFARLALVRTESDPFVETGGSAALAVAKATEETTLLSLGVRAQGDGGDTGFKPYVSAAWNRAFDDRGARVRAGFASGGAPFTITGTLIPKSSAELEAGFDYTTGAFTIGAGYMATLGSDRDTQGARITARFAF
ncbi:autotransporter domain-containing protein [Sphingopyxis indica]|uniref:autotransporter domain-containing protein n=1 Tax=Sphingopyxis indica TaxID=436663 RepID=UPI0029392B90|nr:autotransporter domain-containing protein [Sphingopyxis indica]WOF43572.1 autotransporter domain-containing protein [Sphingopyxis indica]